MPEKDKFKNPDAGVQEAESEDGRSNPLLRAIVDLIPDCIIVKDRNGKILLANQNAASFYGIDAESMIGRYEYEIAGINSSHQTEIDEFLADDRSVIDSGEAKTLPHERITLPNGKKAVFQVTKFPLDVPGYEGCLMVVAADITNNWEARQSLETSEAFLQTLINSIPTPVFYKDKDGRYLGFNNSFEDFFGSTREQMIGKSVFDINPPELARIYHAKDQELFDSGGIQQYESQVKNKRGETRDVIFNKSTFSYENEESSGLIGAIVDITERKNAEKALEESEKKYRSLFESSKDAIYISTVEGDLVEVNNSFLELFRITQSEPYYPNITDYYVDPKERSGFIAEVEQNGYVKDFEVVLRNLAGEEMECLKTATAWRLEDGGIAGYQGVLHDVTEARRKAVEREDLIAQLQKALADVKTLSGLLPICSHCKKIRDDDGYWNQIENYLSKYSEAEFSHSICNDCIEKHYPHTKRKDS